jgi:hypothetical protein
MIYTITRTLGDAIAATLTRSGEFVVNPSDEERAVFTDYDAALEATVSLQVKHDLKPIKSHCTYSLNRLESLPEAA